MKRKYIIVLSVVVLLVCTLLISATIFFVTSYRQKIGENPLKNIPSESEQVPNFVVYGTLYSKYGELSIDRIGKKQNETFVLKEVLCVKDEKVYFVYGTLYEESECWELGAIDLNSLEFQPQIRFIEPAEYYKSAEFYEDYKMQNGYYFEEQIIITDHKKVLVYDLEHQSSQMYQYAEYVFPEKRISSEVLNAEIIGMNNKGISKEYSLEKMAEQSNSIAQIFKLKEHQTWNGKSYLYRFFSECSIQVVENEVYAVCECLNFEGYAYAVILEYIELSDSWRYVTSIRSAAGDIVHGRCYIVP